LWIQALNRQERGFLIIISKTSGPA